jgi:hypothetical protein
VPSRRPWLRHASYWPLSFYSYFVCPYTILLFLKIHHIEKMVLIIYYKSYNIMFPLTSFLLKLSRITQSVSDRLWTGRPGFGSWWGQEFLSSPLSPECQTLLVSYRMITTSFLPKIKHPRHVADHSHSFSNEI